MKTLYTFFLLISLSIVATAQSFCNANGNVILYTNYDGGILKINVDQNIPNIKIGVCSFGAMRIEIVGTYSANVSEIKYAGYNDNTDVCALGVATTSFVAPGTTSTSIVSLPPVTYSNPNGYGYIICGYSCSSTSNQGGCNTPDQIADYFMTQFGGILYYHDLQFNCHTSGVIQNVSAGGNCCITAPIVTGLNEKTLTNNIVSPNPANDLLNITFNNSTAKHTITLFNELGKKVIFLNSFQNHEKINVKELDRGMYFLLIEDGVNTQYQKIILE